MLGAKMRARTFSCQRARFLVTMDPEGGRCYKAVGFLLVLGIVTFAQRDRQAWKVGEGPVFSNFRGRRGSELRKMPQEQEIYSRERLRTLGVQPSTKSDERSVFQLSTFFAPLRPSREA